MIGLAPAGALASKPLKRGSTYESQSPPLVYSPSLMRSRPSARCFCVTAATCAGRSPSATPAIGNGRLPTWVIMILCVLRCIGALSIGMRSVGRVLDHRIGLELGVLIAPADFFHFAQIDVVHHFARRRIDGDRAARALPCVALHGLDQLG